MFEASSVDMGSHTITLSAPFPAHMGNLMIPMAPGLRAHPADDPNRYPFVMVDFAPNQPMVCH